MPLKTKRWNDPTEADDGFRLLICRYRPRGVRKEDETWDAWCSDLGPSKKLHADFYGKNGQPISITEYRQRYLEEMKTQAGNIEELALLLQEGKQITLLCSSACTDARHCHRTLLAELIAAAGGSANHRIQRASSVAGQMCRHCGQKLYADSAGRLMRY